MDNEKAKVTQQGQFLPSGVPFPTALGNTGTLPAVLVSPPIENPSDDPEKSAAIADAIKRDELKVERDYHNNRHTTSNDGTLLGTSGVDSSSSTVTELEKRRRHFGRSRKNKEEMDKKGLQKEEEANALAPVGFIRLFRFATPSEIVLMIIGLILAAASGAAQPLMTLIFGRLTTSFTEYAIAVNEASQYGNSPAVEAAIAQAKTQLKTDSGHNALYLLAIGIGMFLATWSYMFIWNYTGEVLSKRVRQNYLRAVLRQEIAYFDDLGAGEVATRIQTDCHLVQDGTSERVALVMQYLATFVTGFALAFARGWRLALALSSLLPVIMTVGVVMMTLMSKYTTASLEHIAKAGTLAEEVIGSIRTIQAFGTNLVLGKKFDQHINTSAKAGKKGTIIEAAGISTMCKLHAKIAAYN